MCRHPLQPTLNPVAIFRDSLIIRSKYLLPLNQLLPIPDQIVHPLSSVLNVLAQSSVFCLQTLGKILDHHHVVDARAPLLDLLHPLAKWQKYIRSFNIHA